MSPGFLLLLVHPLDHLLTQEVGHPPCRHPRLGEVLEWRRWMEEGMMYSGAGGLSMVCADIG